jgi:hypothetical protein
MLKRPASYPRLLWKCHAIFPSCKVWSSSNGVRYRKKLFLLHDFHENTFFIEVKLFDIFQLRFQYIQLRISWNLFNLLQEYYLTMEWDLAKLINGILSIVLRYWTNSSLTTTVHHSQNSILTSSPFHFASVYILIFQFPHRKTSLFVVLSARV